jgi:hypothetical protein
MSDHVRFVLVREWLRLDREQAKAKEERRAAQKAAESADASLIELGNKRVAVEAELDRSSPGWRDDPDVAAAVDLRRVWVLTPAGEAPDARA